jgi:hypothetical protein
MNKDEKHTDDKIDVEDLIKDFLILNIDSLSKYLKAIWKVRKIIKFIIGSISKK